MAVNECERRYFSSSGPPSLTARDAAVFWYPRFNGFLAFFWKPRYRTFRPAQAQVDHLRSVGDEGISACGDETLARSYYAFRDRINVSNQFFLQLVSVAFRPRILRPGLLDFPMAQI